MMTLCRPLSGYELLSLRYFCERPYRVKIGGGRRLTSTYRGGLGPSLSLNAALSL